MTRRSAISVFAGFLFGPAAAQQTASRLPNRPKMPGKLRLRARTRSASAGGAVQVKEKDLVWNVSETAIIICDMWDDHYCISAARRVAEMAPRMNEVIQAARKHGVMIIHAPSATMDFYAGTPHRRRMIEARHATPPVPIADWCYLDPKVEAPLPIEDEEPCDDEVVRERKRFYNRQHELIEITGFDGISDSGQEIYNFCEQEGITNIVMMGVHTNKCVLGRPFGIRQQVRLGKNIVLARDLTDAMYDPRDKPYVSHKRGTELVIEHIERYWCPSILSDDLMQLAPGSAGPLTSGS